MNISRIFSWTFLVIIVFVVIFFSTFINFLTDFWWFQEVGFTDIFFKSVTAKAIVGFGMGFIALIFFLTNVLLASHAKIHWMSYIPASIAGNPISITQRFVTSIGIVSSIFLSFLIGLIASTQWQNILKFFAATSFGKSDPLFNKDVSFYVFELPVYVFFIGVFKTMLIIAFIGCVVIYLLRRKLDLGAFLEQLTGGKVKKRTVGMMKDKQEVVDAKARLHMGALAALFFVTLAVSTYLSLFDLLTIARGPVSGAAFIDTNVVVPLLYISTGVYILAAIAALGYAFIGKLAPLTLVLGLSVILGLVSAFLPPIVQKLIVAPNELVKETPFIRHNIAATRQAYGLDNVTEKKIEVNKSLTATDIANNNVTIKNVRLWDREQLLSTFSQIQEIRTYYEFASVDNDRYMINGEPRQVMLSPRELASESLPNKNWINEHLTFTHGYGVAAGPVNQATQEGLPVLFVKDLPPKTEVKELAINRPEMYYGELTNNYVIVKSNSKEFDYPKGEENVYATYKGSGGVIIDSPLKKLAYAIKFSSLKMLLSADLTNDSRIMYGRNVKERVEKIAPFLTFDNDPYLVVADGKLSWIFDAYTLTSRYPYSQQLSFNTQNVNYIRNSVKAVVNAYDGKVTFYQADMNDPIIKTYTKIFPTTFRPMSEMPKSLVPHVRYPEDIFTLQTEIYTTYHMDDTQIFYNKEDQWEVPAIPAAGEQQTTTTPAMTPRHMIMKLPTEEQAEYILMLPFTPRAKDNLSAWMVARNDGENYGKLVVYSFPKDKLIYGPKQIIGRINQDSEISRQISLWDQRGSQVIQGPLLVIPIEESLVYVRPLYLKAESGKIPELKRVIVAYENKIAMEETLEEGLSKILGTTTTDEPTNPKQPISNNQPTSTPATSAGNTDLLQQASAAYEAAIAAQKEGDWTKYGEEIQKLGDIIKQLQ